MGQPTKPPGKDFFSLYLHHKLASQPMQPSRADLFFGVPLSLALSCMMIVNLWNGALTGEMGFDRRGSIVRWADNMVGFVIVFAMGVFLALCFLGFTILVLRKSVRSRRRD
jgi:hypothetical protein